jgi:hypothetical protein
MLPWSVVFAPAAIASAIVFGVVTDARQRPGFPTDPAFAGQGLAIGHSDIRDYSRDPCAIEILIDWPE